MLETDSRDRLQGQPENHDELTTAILFQMEAEGVGRVNDDGTPSDPDRWLYVTTGESDWIREDWTLDLWRQWQAEKSDFLTRREADNAFFSSEMTLAATPALADNSADDSREQQLIAEIKAARPDEQEFDLKPISPAVLAKYRANPTGAKSDLVKEWLASYRSQSENVQMAFNAFYDEQPGDDKLMFLYPKRPTNIFYPEEIFDGMNDPAFTELVKFAKAIRLAYEAIDSGGVHNLIEPQDDLDPVRGLVDLDDVSDAPTQDILPNVVPIGLTFAHGLPDSFKSAWAHKLALCIADESATFDGEEIQHGPVAFVTLDSSATRADVAPRLRAIRDRLELTLPKGRFVLTDDRLYLNEPTSVRAFIDANKARGPFKLLVIDSLFNALAGGFSEANILAALAGVKVLLREKFAEAIVIATHDVKTGETMYGPIFQRADAAGIIHFAARNGKVTATVERIKNRPKRTEPLAYTVESLADGPFLASTDERSPSRLPVSPAPDAPIKRADVLALVPTEWIPLATARRPVNALLGDSDAAREKTWQRLRKEWEAAGLIEQRGGNIRRV